MMTRIRFFEIVCLASVLVCLGTARVQAAEQPQYPERRVYDPATDTWTAAPSPIPGTQEGDLQLAIIDLAEGRPKQARSRLKEWLKKYPDSPRRSDAMVALADAELALGNRMKAYRQYEKALEQYPNLESEERIARNEFAIGVAFLSGVKQKVLGIFRFPAQEEGLDILDKVVLRAPGATLAEDAIKAKADYYFRTGRFELAEAEYARLAQEFPRGRYTRLALLMSAQSAIARFPGVRFDESALLEARERFLVFDDRYPEHAEQENVDSLVRRIDETMAEKHLTIGKWYSRQKHPTSASVYYQKVVDRWPESAAASEARNRLAMLSEAGGAASMEAPAPAGEHEAPVSQDGQTGEG